MRRHIYMDISPAGQNHLAYPFIWLRGDFSLEIFEYGFNFSRNIEAEERKKSEKKKLYLSLQVPNHLYWRLKLFVTIYIKKDVKSFTVRCVHCLSCQSCHQKKRCFQFEWNLRKVDQNFSSLFNSCCHCWIVAVSVCLAKSLKILWPVSCRFAAEDLWKEEQHIELSDILSLWLEC